MPKSQLERLWVLGAVIVAILVAFVGYVMFISPQNSDTSNAQSQVSTARLANLRLQSRIDSLRAQSKNLPQYEADLHNAELALPSSSGLPDFLRTLQSIGNATLTNVSSLIVGPPTDVTGVAGVTTVGSGASSASTINGVRIFALPITAQVAGTTNQLNQFLTQLQSVQPRAVLISQLTETNGATANGVTTSGTSLQLTMQAFVAPASSAETAQLSAASGK